MKLGIMQGRLLPPEGGKFQSFPRIRWREEFALAAAAELDSIEWIYDSYGEDVNPLTTDAGVSELERLCVANAIGVKSVCADWFMDFPLTSVDSQSSVTRWDRLRWLMTRCGPLGINRIVVPFVDASAIRSPEETSAVVAGINSLGALIDATNVEIHLETALSPKEFAALLSRLEHPRVKVNYDAGNSASLGYRAREEFAAYGGRVGSVHLKDRIRGGGTVPLGLGDTDFEELFACLKSVGYNGDFILQVARGVEGDELAWTRGNVAMARQMIETLRQT